MTPTGITCPKCGYNNLPWYAMYCRSCQVVFSSLKGKR